MAPRDFSDAGGATSLGDDVKLHTEPLTDDTPTEQWEMTTEGMHVLNEQQRKDVTLADIYEQQEEILNQLSDVREFVTALRLGMNSLAESNNPMLKLLPGLVTMLQQA